MVTDFPNEPSVRERDFVNVRRIDDKLLTVRKDRFKLVHAFAADPEFIVHRRRTRELEFAETLPTFRRQPRLSVSLFNFPVNANGGLQSASSTPVPVDGDHGGPTFAEKGPSLSGYLPGANFPPMKA